MSMPSSSKLADSKKPLLFKNKFAATTDAREETSSRVSSDAITAVPSVVQSRSVLMAPMPLFGPIQSGARRRAIPSTVPRPHAPASVTRFASISAPSLSKETWRNLWTKRLVFQQTSRPTHTHKPPLPRRGNADLRSDEIIATSDNEEVDLPSLDAAPLKKSPPSSELSENSPGLRTCYRKGCYNTIPLSNSWRSCESCRLQSTQRRRERRSMAERLVIVADTPSTASMGIKEDLPVSKTKVLFAEWVNQKREAGKLPSPAAPDNQSSLLGKRAGSMLEPVHLAKRARTASSYDTRFHYQSFADLSKALRSYIRLLKLDDMEDFTGSYASVAQVNAPIDTTALSNTVKSLIQHAELCIRPGHAPQTISGQDSCQLVYECGCKRSKLDTSASDSKDATTCGGKIILELRKVMHVVGSRAIPGHITTIRVVH
ncbi:hypothetical protein K474DRAFT_1664917 [Panus rudis PR-1116 ss-1]|nr:hypothetical protein K474DRAFT_1664917 [Panus rudis PR-1116 ss-1]